MVSGDGVGGEYVHTSWVSCSTGLVYHCGMDNALGKAGVVIVERQNDLGDKKDIVQYQYKIRKGQKNLHFDLERRNDVENLRDVDESC